MCKQRFDCSGMCNGHMPDLIGFLSRGRSRPYFQINACIFLAGSMWGWFFAVINRVKFKIIEAIANTLDL
jgi:hypothetical protein